MWGGGSDVYGHAATKSVNCGLTARRGYWAVNLEVFCLGGVLNSKLSRGPRPAFELTHPFRRVRHVVLFALLPLLSQRLSS